MGRSWKVADESENSLGQSVSGEEETEIRAITEQPRP